MLITIRFIKFENFNNYDNDNNNTNQCLYNGNIPGTTYHKFATNNM